MIANWVKESVSAGGTGNLTLGGAETGLVSLDTAIGQDIAFVYTIEDGSNRECGVGHLSAASTLVRDKILETLVSGTLDRSTPAAITVTTSAFVSIADAAQLVQPGIPVSHDSDVDGVLSACIKDQGNSTQGGLNANQTYFIIHYNAVAGMCSAIRYGVSSGASGTDMQLGIYSVGADGLPDKQLAVTTAKAPAAGQNEDSLTSSIYLPVGWIYIGAVHDSAVAYRGSNGGNDTGPTPLGAESSSGTNHYNYAFIRQMTSSLPTTAAATLKGSTPCPIYQLVIA